MFAFVLGNLGRLILKHTSPVCRPPSSSSLYLRFLSTSTETQLGVYDILRQEYNFPPELASQVVSKLPRLKNPENADSILLFFRESGFSNTQLERTVKYFPRILARSCEDCIKPKFRFFQELGLSSDDISRIISTHPTILGLSLNNRIMPSVSVLKGLLGSGSDNTMLTVIKGAPRFLTMNLENNVLPNVEFLNSCGISTDRIRVVFSCYPGCFLIRPQVMRKCVKKAEEMGLTASSKSFIYAILTLSKMSSEAWENKLQAFRDLGFSDRDISIMFRKVPTTFYISIEKITKMKELLLATGKFNLSCIVNYPKSLSSSIENRFAPRLRILEILESRNLIECWPGLRTISAYSDDEFYGKFISPYLNEVCNVDIIKNFGRGKKEMKP